MSPTKLIRIALLLCMAGLLVQLGATVYWTPLTFVIFSAVGLPLVLLGALFFLRAVWRVLHEKGAL